MLIYEQYQYECQTRKKVVKRLKNVTEHQFKSATDSSLMCSAYFISDMSNSVTIS